MLEPALHLTAITQRDGPAPSPPTPGTCPVSSPGRWPNAAGCHRPAQRAGDQAHRWLRSRYAPASTLAPLGRLPAAARPEPGHAAASSLRRVVVRAAAAPRATNARLFDPDRIGLELLVDPLCQPPQLFRRRLQSPARIFELVARLSVRLVAVDPSARPRDRTAHQSPARFAACTPERGLLTIGVRACSQVVVSGVPPRSCRLPLERARYPSDAAHA
eukprot:114315-Prymnesium_polylepis.1